jgi:hypothetical protein
MTSTTSKVTPDRERNSFALRQLLQPGLVKRVMASAMEFSLRSVGGMSGEHHKDNSTLAHSPLVIAAFPLRGGNPAPGR